MRDKLRGVIVPIGTPVDQRERVDEKGLRKLARHLIDAGVHAILANGSMGGFAHLEDSEQLKCVEIVLDEVGRRIPVIANVGETGTRRVLRMTSEMERLGPDYLAVLPPFYFLMTQEELKAFYWEILDSVTTPTFVYNSPVATKLDLAFETICELSRHPNAVGIKDSKQDFDKWMRMVWRFRETPFSVCVGTELLAAPALAMGCDGVIAGLHNICPRIAVELYEAVRAARFSRADELQRKLSDLFAIFQIGGVWGAFELALRRLGICDKATIKPFGPIENSDVEAQILEILASHLEVSEPQTLSAMRADAAAAGIPASSDKAAQRTNVSHPRCGSDREIVQG
jgi:4-hydroxy-tetrahydrodipicolinate synthase